jgi:hypothetical protein
MPSATGLHVFAKREGLWDSTAEALHVGGQTAIEAVKILLQAYHQKQLNQPLDVAVTLVAQIPELALHYYTNAMVKFAEAPMSTQQPAQSQPVTAAMPPAITDIWEALMSHRPGRSGQLRTDGTTVTLGGRPIFRVQDGMVSGSWGDKVTLSTASVLNSLSALAGIQRPFKVGLGSGEAMCNDQPVSPMAWTDLGPAPSHSPLQATASTEFHATELGCPPLKQAAAKTAMGYPQAVLEKGGDPGKVRQALEKAVKALNEATTSALKFDDRLIKLEKDTYAIFREYLNHDQQTEVLEAREKAKEQAGQVPGRTAALRSPEPERMGGRWHFKEHQASLSTPPTDERAGEFDHGDVGDEGDSVTAAAALSDEEILTAAKTKSLAQAREEYINGRMSQDLFDAFVPLWEALHQKDGAAQLQGALDRGDIDQHIFDLGQQLLAKKS